MSDLALRPAASAPATGTPSACLAAVEQLLGDLTGEALLCEAEAQRGKETSARWDAFHAAWTARWQRVGLDCALGNDPALGRRIGVERMAWVHRTLPDLAREYRDRLARLDREIAPDLAEMRRALDKSRAQLGLEGQRAPEMKESSR